MADDPRLVELLKFYKKKGTVTRPEVGTLTDKSVGQIAGTCNRAGITGWPKIEPGQSRPCQFPILKNGIRDVCGKECSADDTLRCSEHRRKVWDPDAEETRRTSSKRARTKPARVEPAQSEPGHTEPAAAEPAPNKPVPIAAEPMVEEPPQVEVERPPVEIEQPEANPLVDDQPLVELLKFYRSQATVTPSEVGVLVGKAPEQIEELCQRHDIKPWPRIASDTVRDRPCQFPVRRQTGRYVCGHMRPLNADADPLRCSEHAELVWDPSQEK